MSSIKVMELNLVQAQLEVQESENTIISTKEDMKRIADHST
jgi:hypothetical protein